jgi:putative endonuclease
VERVAGRQELAAQGEETVARWYQSSGYIVVARNWRCRQGELDLVLRQGDLIVFCEVKTRTSAAFGAPVEAVTRAKQARLRRAAGRFLDAGSEHAGVVRFDVASVLGGVVEVVEGAF